MKTRFLVTFLLVLALSMSVNLGVSKAVTSSPIDLGTLGGTWSNGIKINEAGMVIGTSAIGSQGGGHAFFWFEGTMVDLGTLGGTNSTPADLNSEGQVVGSSATSNGQTHAFLWDSGNMIDLGTVGGTYSYAADINASGEIVGCSSVEGDQNIHAVYWGSDGIIDLGALFESDSCAHSINDRGQILGYYYTFSGEYHGFLYQNGVIQDLGDFEPQVLSDNGYALGKTIDSDGKYTGVIWDGTSLYLMETIEGINDIALLDMNARGQVIGRYYDQNWSERHFIWQEGVYDFIDFTAIRINDSGRVLGSQWNASTGTQGLLWFKGAITNLNGLEDGNTVYPAEIANNGFIVGSCYVSNNANPHACIWINQ